jgi:hypothetical protein
LTTVVREEETQVGRGSKKKYSFIKMHSIKLPQNLGEKERERDT